MFEVEIGKKYIDKMFGSEVEIETIYEPHGEILYRFDDNSMGLSHSEEEFLSEYEEVKEVLNTSGWLTVVRDDVVGVYFLDVVHVTCENAEKDFYTSLISEEVELLGFKYVSWSNRDDA